MNKCTNIEMSENDAAILFTDGQPTLVIPKQEGHEIVGANAIQVMRCAVFLANEEMVAEIDAMIFAMKSRPQ